VLNVVGAEKSRRRIDLSANKYRCVKVAYKGFIAGRQSLISVRNLRET